MTQSHFAPKVMQRRSKRVYFVLVFYVARSREEKKFTLIMILYEIVVHLSIAQTMAVVANELNLRPTRGRIQRIN